LASLLILGQGGALEMTLPLSRCQADGAKDSKLVAPELRGRQARR
jgi:hypothetical protein